MTNKFKVGDIAWNHKNKISKITNVRPDGYLYFENNSSSFPSSSRLATEQEILEFMKSKSVNLIETLIL